MISGIREQKVKERPYVAYIGENRMLPTPLNLNIDRLLVENEFRTNLKKLRREELREWIILFVAFFYTRPGKIHSDQLRGIWPQYAEVTEWLSKAGVLWVRNHSEGNFSKSYELDPKYRGIRPLPVFNPRILKKVPLIHRDEVNERTSFLRSFFNDLTCDDDQLRYLAKRRREKMQELYRKHRGSLDNSILTRWQRDFKKRTQLSRTSINNGLIDFIPDPNTTRLYTTVSMMVSDQRAYLKYKGKLLWEADMSCAMPYLALGILLPYGYERLRMREMIESQTEILKHPKEHEELFGLLETIHESGIDKYRDLVCSGSLYDYLAQGQSRDQTKRDFFSAIFDKPDKESKSKKRLMEEFPDVIRVFDLLKTGFVKTRKEGRRPGEPTNGLCMILYRLESRLFIDQVAKMYHKYYPEAPIFTVHDAILSTEEHIYDIRRLIIEKAEEMIGIAPKVNVKKRET